MHCPKILRVFTFTMLLSAVACEAADEVHHYQIKYQLDVNPDDAYDYQERMQTNSHTECNKALNVDVKDDVRSYFLVMVFYHSSFGYDLLGSHQLYTKPPDDPHYRHGFYAKYKYCHENISCSDTPSDKDDPVAVSGTVTVTEKGGELEMDFDIVFSDGVHETGHWKLEQCGDPVVVNP